MSLYDLYECPSCGPMRLARITAPKLDICPYCTRRGRTPVHALRFVREIGPPALPVSHREIVDQIAATAGIAAASDLSDPEDRLQLRGELRRCLARLGELEVPT